MMLLNGVNLKLNYQTQSLSKKRKNWYVSIDNCIITINANSYTIITAHKEKKNRQSL